MVKGGDTSQNPAGETHHHKKKKHHERKEHPMKEPDDRSRRCFLKASSILGLAVAFRPATIGEAFAESKSNTAQKEMV